MQNNNSYAKTAPEYFLRWECFLFDRIESFKHDTESHFSIMKKDWSPFSIMRKTRLRSVIYIYIMYIKKRKWRNKIKEDCI